MGSMNMAKKAMYVAPLMNVRVVAFPSMSSARGLSWRPMRMDMRVEAPTPTRTPMAVVMFIRGNVRAIPAIASGPTTWPMNTRSTMLYRAITSIPTTAGRLYSHRRRPTGRVARLLRLMGWTGC